MIFICGPNKLTYFFSIIFAELVYIEIERKMHFIKIIANGFNGFNDLCFQKLVFNFLSFSVSIVLSHGLV